MGGVLSSYPPVPHLCSAPLPLPLSSQIAIERGGASLFHSHGPPRGENEKLSMIENTALEILRRYERLNGAMGQVRDATVKLLRARLGHERHD